MDKKCRPDGAVLSKFLVVLPKYQPYGLDDKASFYGQILEVKHGIL